MNIMFWNTNCQKGNENKFDEMLKAIIELVADNNIDLLVLAEYHPEISNLCNEVNMSGRKHYVPLPNIGDCKRIKGIFKNNFNVIPVQGQEHYMIVKVETTYYTLLVAMIHGISKLFSTQKEQELSMWEFHHDIVTHESNLLRKNTIVIGDFNINPFETACIGAGYMHAIPYIEEVHRQTRTVNGKEYVKFYNPTWKFLGNRGVPYSTYHYDNSGKVDNFYWNVFDQVLIRPSLIPAFDESKLGIISRTKNHVLTKQNGKPNKTKYSDHLPLFCILKEEMIL